MHYLFKNGFLHDWLRARLEEARQAAQGIPPDRALSVPEPDLVRELLDRYRVNPPRLKLEQRYSPGARDVLMDVGGGSYVHGTRVEVRVPFDGDPELFRLFPSMFTTVLPRGTVEGQVLVVWHEAPWNSVNPEQFQKHLDDTLHQIQECIGWVLGDCTKWNDELQRELGQTVQQRRKKVLQDRNLEAFLGIPVQRRSDASPVFSVPVQPRRKPASALGTRPPATQPFAPEPAIAPEDYAQILTVVKSWRDLVERLPRTFSPMSEEVLRDILLVVLNNQFGPAGGEVFSRKGKTDIFIWHEKGAVFVAECKFWGAAGSSRKLSISS